MKKIAALLLATVISACSANAKAIEHAEAACVADDATDLANAANAGSAALTAYVNAHDVGFLQCVIAAMKAKAPPATPPAAK